MKEELYDVFISYSRKDTKIADKICKAFDDAGITYFIDKHGIGGGMEFPAVLAKAIRSSKVFLFLASENSYASKFTQSEIVYAFNKKSKQDIIPYIIDGSMLPDELEFTFSSINWRNMLQHPIDTVLVDDVLLRLGRQRSEDEKTKVSYNEKKKETTASSFLSFLSPNRFTFTGRTAALSILGLSILLVLIILVLGVFSNYIKSHNIDVVDILIFLLFVLFIITLIGYIRPASLCLPSRKEISRYYLSSVLIIFLSICIYPEIDYTGLPEESQENDIEMAVDKVAEDSVSWN